MLNVSWVSSRKALPTPPESTSLIRSANFITFPLHSLLSSPLYSPPSPHLLNENLISPSKPPRTPHQVHLMLLQILIDNLPAIGMREVTPVIKPTSTHEELRTRTIVDLAAVAGAAILPADSDAVALGTAARVCELHGADVKGCVVVESTLADAASGWARLTNCWGALSLPSGESRRGGICWGETRSEASWDTPGTPRYRQAGRESRIL